MFLNYEIEWEFGDGIAIFLSLFTLYITIYIY